MRSSAMLTILFLGIFAGWIVPAKAQVYPVINQENAAVGRLSAAQYDSVRRELQLLHAGSLKDTVILQYEFDKVPVGNMPRKNDELFQQKITEELRFLHAQLVTRKNISIFNMVSPPTEGNTAAAENSTAYTDPSGIIGRIFPNGGSRSFSLLLLPDRNYITLAAPHRWPALALTATEIDTLVKGALSKNELPGR